MGAAKRKQDEEVRRRPDSFSGNGAVVDILEKMSSNPAAESCDEDDVPTEWSTINQRPSALMTAQDDDGSKQQVESFAEQATDGSFLFTGGTRFLPGSARFRLKGSNKFNGKKPRLDNGHAPATSCEKKPAVASHCTCLHEASSSDSSRIEHHMSPIPDGFTTKQVYLILL